MDAYSEKKLLRMLIFCVVCLFAASVPMHAKLYYFGQVNGSASGPYADSFTMEVEERGTQVLFTFTNDYDSKGALSRLFFMDTGLLIFRSIEDYSVDGDDDPRNDVAFSYYAGNAMLPGGAPLGFTPQNSFGIFADPASPHHGLHYGEYVSILFDLDGASFKDVIDQIDGRSLGVGIQTQASPGGASASFSTIPEPLTLSLLGFGVLLIHNKKHGTAQ